MLTPEWKLKIYIINFRRLKDFKKTEKVQKNVLKYYYYIWYSRVDETIWDPDYNKSFILYPSIKRKTFFLRIWIVGSLDESL